MFRQSSGLFLSLALVSSRRKVVIAFCATRMVYCTTLIHVQKFQRCLDLMYSIVAVVTGLELALV